LSFTAFQGFDDDASVKSHESSHTTWRGWATPGGSASKPVKSTRLAPEAQVKSRLFPKTRSWLALGAPLELLSPLSVLRIVFALLLLAWPLTAAVAGTTSTNVYTVVIVEVLTFAVWFGLLRVRNLGLRSCRVLMAFVSLEVVALVGSGAGTLASFGYMLVLIPIAIAPALFLPVRAVLCQQFGVGAALWAATASRWGIGRSAVIVFLEMIGGLTASFTIILLARTVQRRGGIDPDTGLPNGFGLADRVARRGEKDATVVASVFLKGIGDAREALGCHVGTELLRRAVENLDQVLPAAADIGRVDGDELVVISGLENTAHETREEADAYAQSLAETLRDAITAGRYLVDDIEVSLRANVGLAIAPWDGTGVPELIRRATLSARKAAAQGRAHVTWSGDEGVLTANDLALLARLRLASERGELSLAYQPQVSSRTLRIVSAEALLRWGSVTLGSVPPGMFVPLAERTGLIDRLTEWVMGEALDAQVRWRAAGLDIPVSVNLSATSLTVPDLAEWILSELENRKLPPASLIVEVTETAAIDLLQAVALLRPLHDRGVRVSIDDFGTGYTSLSALPDLPLDELKVDQRFVLRSSTSAADETIVRTVRELARRLGLVAVAEGVENQELLDKMVGFEFDILQGYHLARPLTEVDFVALVMDQEIEQHRAQVAERSGSAPPRVNHGSLLGSGRSD
jgi:EAL domain-containing protein (putative c-di-GMP-specific phosphodiesterase class I)/GGDEF domain-containing protein